MQLAKSLRLYPNTSMAMVGAGGKSTTIFRLAHELPPPVVVTTTTHLAVTQLALADHQLTLREEPDLEALSQTSFDGVSVLTNGLIENERVCGPSLEHLDKLHTLLARQGLPLLIEADGARQKALKAPAEHEPAIPSFTQCVVVVAGLSGLGKPLDATSVHRPQIFGRLSGLNEGDAITLDSIAAVLIHPQGGLKNIPATSLRIALLNQADTPLLQSAAQSLVPRLLPSYSAVVVGSLESSRDMDDEVSAVFEPTAGLILAAGGSERFGSPKQLLDWHGQPFVRSVAETALKAGLDPVLVVTGAFADQVQAALQGLPVELVHNPDWESGQASSVRSGIQALTHRIGAVLFMLCDQPQLPTTLIQALLEKHAHSLAPIIAPLISEQRGNPVLFDQITFPDLLQLSGDTGGRALFSRYPISWVPWHDPGLLLDVDTPQDYQQLLDLD